MPARDDYIAKARVSGEYLVNSDRITPGSSTSQAHATSVLAYLALAELPEVEPDLTEAVEDAVADAQEAVALEAAVEAEKPAEKPKRSRAKK